MGTTLPSYDYGTTLPEITATFGVLGGIILIIFLFRPFYQRQFDNHRYHR